MPRRSLRAILGGKKKMMQRKLSPCCASCHNRHTSSSDKNGILDLYFKGYTGRNSWDEHCFTKYIYQIICAVIASWKVRNSKSSVLRSGVNFYLCYCLRDVAFYGS